MVGSESGVTIGEVQGGSPLMSSWLYVESVSGSKQGPGSKYYDSDK